MVELVCSSPFLHFTSFQKARNPALGIIVHKHPDIFFLMHVWFTEHHFGTTSKRAAKLWLSAWNTDTHFGCGQFLCVIGTVGECGLLWVMSKLHKTCVDFNHRSLICSSWFHCNLLARIVRALEDREQVNVIVKWFYDRQEEEGVTFKRVELRKAQNSQLTANLLSCISCKRKKKS